MKIRKKKGYDTRTILEYLINSYFFLYYFRSTLISILKI